MKYCPSTVMTAANVRNLDVTFGTLIVAKYTTYVITYLLS
jgi:hypothetical protein